jgi:hypothetical protein
MPPAMKHENAIIKSGALSPPVRGNVVPPPVAVVPAVFTGAELPTVEPCVPIVVVSPGTVDVPKMNEDDVVVSGTVVVGASEVVVVGSSVDVVVTGTVVVVVVAGTVVVVVVGATVVVVVGAAVLVVVDGAVVVVSGIVVVVAIVVVDATVDVVVVGAVEDVVVAGIVVGVVVDGVVVVEVVVVASCFGLHHTTWLTAGA